MEVSSVVAKTTGLYIFLLLPRPAREPLEHGRLTAATEISALSIGQPALADIFGFDFDILGRLLAEGQKAQSPSCAWSDRTVAGWP